MRTAIAILMLISLAMTAGGKVKTTRKALRSDAVQVGEWVQNDANVSVVDTIDSDTAQVKFKQGAIAIKGYVKRASDIRESFLITNKTGRRITRVRMLMRYSDTEGGMIHEREVNVACDLKDGETKQVSVPSFDKHRSFYYYAGDKPRKRATPFVVQVRILSYDIPVENPNQ